MSNEQKKHATDGGNGNYTVPQGDMYPVLAPTSQPNSLSKTSNSTSKPTTQKFAPPLPPQQQHHHQTPSPPQFQSEQKQCSLSKSQKPASTTTQNFQTQPSSSPQQQQQQQQQQQSPERTLKRSTSGSKLNTSNGASYQPNQLHQSSGSTQQKQQPQQHRHHHRGDQYGQSQQRQEEQHRVPEGPTYQQQNIPQIYQQQNAQPSSAVQFQQQPSQQQQQQRATPFGPGSIPIQSQQLQQQSQLSNSAPSHHQHQQQSTTPPPPQQQQQRYQPPPIQQQNPPPMIQQYQQPPQQQQQYQPPQQQQPVYQPPPPQQPQQTQLINEFDWFQNVAGVEENVLKTQKEKHFKLLTCGLPFGSQKNVPMLTFVNPLTNRTYRAGMFYLSSIKDLRRFITKQPQKQQVPCILDILCRGDYYSTRFVDIAALQADPANQRAMFQAASNFNGVEAISDTIPPDTPHFTEMYVRDRTQGPTASISAAPAAIARVHAAFYDEKKPPNEWNQTKEKQLQMLENVSKYFTVTNGYVTNGINPNHLEEVLPTDPQQLDNILAEVKLGIHWNVDVTYGARGQNGMEVLKEPHDIHQIFCAAMNIGQGASGMQNANQPGAREKSIFLLRAAYQGTYLAAIAAGVSKLYLTMIGGGVFGNDFCDIFNEILIAHKQLALSNVNNCLKNVYLVLFSPPPGKEDFMNRLQQENVPFRSLVFMNNEQTIEFDNTSNFQH